jgi:signal transduction histidine kinase/ActR/RegA family two-component response regulator
MAIAVTAVVYFLAAKLGLGMAVVASEVTTVWPPTGIALAAIILWGNRVAVGVALGAFLANLLTPGETVWTAAAIAAGNTLEALAGASLLRAVGFEPSLERLRDVLALVLLAAGLSTTVSATVGVVTICLAGKPWTEFATLWWVWWTGDAIGDIVVAPAILTWARAWPRLATPRLLEAGVLGVGVLATCAIVFVGPLAQPVTGYPLHYAIFPFVAWAALRFGQRGTTAVTIAAAAVAVWSIANGWGPFATGTLHERLLLLLVFLATVAVTGLLLAAAVAERDRAKERGAADYARLELALDAGRMGVWDWTIATGEIAWTENLEPIHGLPPGAFPDRFAAFEALVHPDDSERIRAAIRAALEAGPAYDVEFRILRPDGRVHWIAVKGRVLRDPDGTPVRMLGVAADVTQRRELEDELRRRVQQLADADRRKDEFLAMLAHELRNPLAPLSTALHLLPVATEKRDDLLAMAERQVRQLVRLVDDLLDVSRITGGKIALRRERIALGDVVARALETTRPLVESRGHDLTVSLPAEAVGLDADPARLAQVVANLLSNAAKYTPPGGRIWLTAETAGGEVVIRVRDTGAGLAPELVANVFDLFVQGDTSLDRTRGGLGIGLTIVRRLVELHGGRVEARSPGVGQGSEFIVRLPALPTAAPASRAAPPASHDGARPLGVLVVEDNEDAAEGLAMVLRLWGHDVHVAYDAAAALEAAERHTPDVVLSDLGLPGMSGYELAQRLRQRPGFGRAVLIALSGYGRDEDKRRAVEAGFDHHLVKPPDLDALARLLGRAAARGRPVA